nr:hypothetical protein [Pseudonocardia sp. ICBG601]
MPGRAGVVHGDDAGVVDRGGGAGLVAQPGDVAGVARAQEQLHRDRAVQLPVVGQVHRRHPAPAEHVAQLVAAAHHVTRARQAGRDLVGALRSGRARQLGRPAHDAGSVRCVLSGCPAPISSSNR